MLHGRKGRWQPHKCINVRLVFAIEFAIRKADGSPLLGCRRDGALSIVYIKQRRAKRLVFECHSSTWRAVGARAIRWARAHTS